MSSLELGLSTVLHKLGVVPCIHHQSIHPLSVTQSTALHRRREREDLLNTHIVMS